MIMKIFWRILVIMLVLACGSNQLLFAGSDSRIGTAGAAQLLIPVGSIGPALGGSYLAVAKGIDAIDWNPAGLAAAPYSVQSLFSRMSYIADMDVNYLALAGKAGNLGVFALSMKWLSVGDIEITTIDTPEGTGVSFSPAIMTMGLTFSRAMTDRIYFGANLKSIFEKYDTISGKTVAVDLGLQYIEGLSGVRFGVALKNLGPSMRYDGSALEHYVISPDQASNATPQPLRVRLAGVDLPATLEMGVGYDYQINGAYGLLFSGSYINNNYTTDEYRAGVEFSFKDLFFIRGGYNFAESLDRPGTNGAELSDDATITNNKLSFGLGFNLKQGRNHIAFDYAYRPVEFFDSTQWFTLSLGF